MFTHKLLTTALVATFTLTACNSSTTKPSPHASDLMPTSSSSGKKGVGGIAHDDPATMSNKYLVKTGVSEKGVRDATAKDNDFSVIYHKVTRNNKSVEELVDGDHLQDGDRYKVDITAGNKPTYIYVYQIDSKGKLFDLLKIAGKHRGVLLQAGQSISLPNDNESYVLDNAKGMENIVVVASDSENPSLEKIYREAARDLTNSEDKGTSKKIIASKGPRPAVMTDTGDAVVQHKELDLSGTVSSKKFSCNNQPACASSISFFNNM